MPPGTMSTMFEVTDRQGNLVARCHAYVLPNGIYGASGKLDPKSLRSGNTTYYV